VYKVYYTNRTLPTRFDLSCGGLLGGAFRRTDTSKYYRSFEPMHRYKKLNFKNNTWLKHIKDQNTNKTYNNLYCISVHLFKTFGDIRYTYSFQYTSLKMATWVPETCRRSMQCIIYFHTRRCTFLFWYHIWLFSVELRVIQPW